MKRQIIGINSINSAFDRNIKITTLYMEQGKSSQRLNQIEAIAQKKGFNIIKVDRIKLDLMVIGAKHQGVIAEIELDSEKMNLADIMQIDNSIILILDGIQDPHNLGACLRSAAAANVSAVVLPKDSAASITAVVSKVASGGAEIVPIFFVSNLARTLEDLKENNFWSVALTGDAEKTIYQTDFKGKMAIIMGAEGKGISRLLLEKTDYQAKIPMLGDMESLNVSVATGITLFEAIRQREFC